MRLLRGNPFVLALKVLILAAILVWVLHGLNYRAIFITLRKFPPAVFVLAVGVQILTQLLQAWRWKILVGRTDIRYRDYLGFISLGYSLALVSPSVLISDSASAFLLGRRNQAVARSVSAMAAGRFLGITAMGVFFLTALPVDVGLLHRIPWKLRTSFFVAVPILVLGALAVFWITRRYGERARELLRQIRAVFGRPRALAAGMCLSIAVQGLNLTLPWLGFRAMAIPIQFHDVLFFMPLITLLAMAPVSIGQIGVREGLGIFFFTLLPGVTKEQLIAGFGYGYALFAVMGLLNLAFAGLVLRRAKTQ